MSIGVILGIFAIYIVATFCNVVSGFGFAIIATPLMSIFWGPKAAVLYITASSSLLRLVMMWRTRHDFNAPVVGMTLLGIVVGVIPGSYVLKIIGSAELNIFLGCLLFAAVWLMGRRVALPVHNVAWGRFDAGVLCGFFSGCTSVGGPPLALWFVNEDMPKLAMRGNLIWSFACSSFLTLAGSFITGTVSAVSDWYSVIYTLPGIVLGYVAGQHYFSRIDQERFRQLVLAIILLGAVTALGSGLWQKLSV